MKLTLDFLDIKSLHHFNLIRYLGKICQNYRVKAKTIFCKVKETLTFDYQTLFSSSLCKCGHLHHILKKFPPSVPELLTSKEWDRLYVIATSTFVHQNPNQFHGYCRHGGIKKSNPMIFVLVSPFGRAQVHSLISCLQLHLDSGLHFPRF